VRHLLHQQLTVSTLQRTGHLPQPQFAIKLREVASETFDLLPGDEVPSNLLPIPR
jgi:hypothetical protein